MKRSLVALSLIVLIVLFSGCGNVPSAKNIVMKNTTDSVSCALGYYFAHGAKQQFSRALPFDTIDMKMIAGSIAKSKPNQQLIDNLT